METVFEKLNIKDEKEIQFEFEIYENSSIYGSVFDINENTTWMELLVKIYKYITARRVLERYEFHSGANNLEYYVSTMETNVILISGQKCWKLLDTFDVEEIEF